MNDLDKLRESQSVKVHLFKRPTPGWAGRFDTKCGKPGIPESNVTEDPRLVTCATCVVQVTVPEEGGWSCKFCNAEVSEVDVCRTCGIAVCPDCDEVPLLGARPHKPTDHRSWSR